MDIVLFPRQSRLQWADTMINLEARKLVNTANTVAAMHLSDSLARLKFVDEIRKVVMQQFEAARKAKLPQGGNHVSEQTDNEGSGMGSQCKSGNGATHPRSKPFALVFNSFQDL